MNINVETAGKYNIAEIARADGRAEYQIILRTDEEGVENAYFKLNWSFPIKGIAGRWHPTCGKYRGLVADWTGGRKSMTVESAPVMNFFSEDDRNCYTAALSETKKEVVMAMGVHEEDGTMKCDIKVNVGDMLPNEEYKVALLIDERNIPYYKSIYDVQTWWADECGITPTDVPDIAKDATYSFWYSYHQNFTDEEIEEECKRAKELGFTTVILDDGWQTDDMNRGYAFCGDWEVAESKIKDMKRHVEKVHEIGLKYMIWYSVPYVGIKSKNWERFKDKLVLYRENHQAGLLDVRYKEVRSFLKNIYINAVKNWNLDGLKLDFIDDYCMQESTAGYNENMDFRCIQDAVDCLLSETMQELRAIKSDFMIEFRQDYIGPNIRKYGNILRVCDCPMSWSTNKVGIVDLRLLSGKTAIHADPIMWHKDETAENAALQLASCLFATLQFSVGLAKLSESQKEVVKNYLTFMKEKKTLLQDSMIEPKEPGNLYPEVRVANEKEEIIAVYSANRVVTIAGELEQSIVVNGVKSSKVYLKLTTEDKHVVKNIDCQGNFVNTIEIEGPGIIEMACAPGSRLEITK